MSLISWNCRGFVSSSIVKELNEVCGKFNPHVVFLMKTKVKSWAVEESFSDPIIA